MVDWIKRVKKGASLAAIALSICASSAKAQNLVNNEMKVAKIEAVDRSQKQVIELANSIFQKANSKNDEMMKNVLKLLDSADEARLKAMNNSAFTEGFVEKANEILRILQSYDFKKEIKDLEGLNNENPGIHIIQSALSEVKGLESNRLGLIANSEKAVDDAMQKVKN